MIFTAAATALFASTALAGTFAVGATAFALQMAAGVGISYAAQAIAGKPASQQQAANRVGGIQGKLQGGGEVPRSFPVGDCFTTGSLTYANYWGSDGDTPNAYFTQVIALSDLAIPGIRTYFVNSEAVTLLTGEPHPDRGAPVQQYRKDGKDHLWIKFYDGTQTTADPFVANYVSNAERPYGPDRVGYGVAYVICTFLVNDELFGRWPEYGFGLQSVRWYDPSRDSSIGGVGPQRWADRSTWGGDGDNLPVVQAYNIKRGITFEGQWLYGLQNTAAAQLPAAAWINAIGACRDPIEREDGFEPTYRAGHECRVNARIDDTIEMLLTACHGKMSEAGGAYKPHIGRPGAPVLHFTDADIIATEEQSLTPFFGLSKTINGIAATYPEPTEGWTMKAAPTLLAPELEARDGNRRLMADVKFDAVPYAAQVQHLMKSALEEAQRARRHTHTMAPWLWGIEAGDVVSWTSFEHGYVEKLFRVDGCIDKANLDVMFDLTEVDPSDHSYNHDIDFTPVPRNPIGFVRPAAQAMVDFYAEPGIVYDRNGLARRCSIILGWDGSVTDDIAAIQFEVRNDFDTKEVIHRGRTENVAEGEIAITQGTLPLTDYEVHARYIPANPRETLWSDWIKVTTLDIRIGEPDITQALLYNLTELLDAMDDRLLRLESSQVAANSAARAARDNIRLRGQTVKMIDRVELKIDDNLASIEEVRELAVSNEGSIATLTESVEARFGNANALIQTNAEAISTVDLAFSSYRVSTNTKLGQLTASAEVTQEAIAGIGARYTISLDNNGYVVGSQLINGGPGFSFFGVTVDNFWVALPGVTGGAAVKPFVIGYVNGALKIGMRADQVLIDASVYTRHLTAGAVTTDKVQAGSIGTNQLMVGGVAIENLIAGAATKITSKSEPGSYTLPAPDTVYSLISHPVFCAGGVMHVIGTISYANNWGTFNFGGNGRVSATDGRTEVYLYVDGALVDTFVFDTQFDRNTQPGYTIYIPGRFTAAINKAVAVTQGTHTFEVRAKFINNSFAVPANAGPVFDKRELTMFESRR